MSAEDEKQTALSRDDITWANQSPQLISLSTKNHGDQGSMVLPH